MLTNKVEQSHSFQHYNTTYICEIFKCSFQMCDLISLPNFISLYPLLSLNPGAAKQEIVKVW